MLRFLLFCFFSFALCSKPLLTDFADTTYSQLGEDGIIAKIFEKIGTHSKLCVEFGAHDGIFASNVARLWKDLNWQAVLIECDPYRYEQLKKNVYGKNCVAIHEQVGNQSHNSIETILDKYGIDEEIDLMCIDIDGNDYYILESLNSIRPRVIVCEFNPTIPLHVDLYGSYNNYFGASAGSLMRIAKQKGYTLVSVINCNCFFVRNDEVNKLDEFEIDFAHIKYAFETNPALRRDGSLIYIVTGYDGKYKVVKSQPTCAGITYTYGLTSQYVESLNGDMTLLPFSLDIKP